MTASTSTAQNRWWNFRSGAPAVRTPAPRTSSLVETLETRLLTGSLSAPPVPEPQDPAPASPVDVGLAEQGVDGSAGSAEAAQQLSDESLANTHSQNAEHAEAEGSAQAAKPPVAEAEAEAATPIPNTLPEMETLAVDPIQQLGLSAETDASLAAPESGAGQELNLLGPMPSASHEGSGPESSGVDAPTTNSAVGSLMAAATGEFVESSIPEAEQSASSNQARQNLTSSLSGGDIQKIIQTGSYAAATPAQETAAQLTADEVLQLLDRAAAASDTQDAIIAIVDRQGQLLGVRVEQDVLDTFAGRTNDLVFAIDGAIAEARTGAFFGNNEAPLTSRTVRSLSETTITQREVQANPNVDPGDPTSTVRGPGTVGVIGVGGHFPPGILHAPPVDLFDIEHTNRDSLLHPGPDLIKGTADDIVLTSRFNADYIPGQELAAPESYGFISGLLPTSQGRGIGTLPGGIPLVRRVNPNGTFVDTANGATGGDTVVVGGIGVFFPGPNGYADFQQGFIPGIGQSETERLNSRKNMEAEFIALAAIGGSNDVNTQIGTLDGVDRVQGIDLPFGRIDLVGINLQVVGPTAGILGVRQLVDFSNTLVVGAAGSSTSGANQQVTTDPAVTAVGGEVVPVGWLVAPKDSADPNGLKAADVLRIINQGIAEANAIRAAIRLPLGTRTKMVLAVTDTDGEVLGFFRMPDATYFSNDVAVTKARNVAYYDDPVDLQAVDQLPGMPRGVAFENRTFRFLAEPRFPSGVDGSIPSPFSILNDPGINNATAENTDQLNPTQFGQFQSVLGFTKFNPIANFRDPGDVGTDPNNPLAVSNINQSGVIYFPGSSPAYINGNLVGGFGISGDGVDQDDVVTFSGIQGFFPPPTVLRADEVAFRDTRLPFMKFNRNPRA